MTLRNVANFILRFYATITLRAIAAIIFCITTIILFSGLSDATDTHLAAIIGYASSAFLLFAHTQK